MTRKKDPQKEINERYWKNQKTIQIKEEYQLFLKNEELKNSQTSIEKFTIPRTLNGQKEYKGFTERELIKILGGVIPDYY
jgi:guanylate kinase